MQVTLTLLPHILVPFASCIPIHCKSYPIARLMSKGQSKLNILSRNLFFSNSDLALDHRHLGSNPKMLLGISYPYTQFGVKRFKQAQVIEQKLIF